jgi:hypothetical protein
MSHDTRIDLFCLGAINTPFDEVPFKGFTLLVRVDSSKNPVPILAAKPPQMTRTELLYYRWKMSA